MVYSNCYGIVYITESLIVTQKQYEHQTRSDHEQKDTSCVGGT